MSTNSILFSGMYGKIYKQCLEKINAMPKHERTLMQIIHTIDEVMKAEYNGPDMEKCRMAMICRLEPMTCSYCEGCGAELSPDYNLNDRYCSYTCYNRG